jgi:hypothetical protein
MNISYENTMNLAFDKPLEYKTLSLYPAKLFYYSIFSSADECLDVSRLDERDLRLMRLPYLEYMYEKSLINEDFKNRWNMLICILSIVLQEQSFDIIRENGRLYLKVYQRSKDYELLNKQYKALQDKIIEEYSESKKIDDIKEYATKMEEIKDKMFNIITISSEEFDEMRQLIMLQNDIKPQHFNAETEKLLYEMKIKLKSTRKDNSYTTMEDLITIVSYSMHISNEEMENLTIRRFNRYLDIALSKDDYYMYKSLELSGAIKMKSEIPHWIKHYEPKGKFDDVLVDGGNLLTSLGDGKI